MKHARSLAIASVACTAWLSSSAGMGLVPEPNHAPRSRVQCAPLVPGIYISVHGGGQTLLHALDPIIGKAVSQDGRHGRLLTSGACQYTLDYGPDHWVALWPLSEATLGFQVHASNSQTVLSSGVLMLRQAEAADLPSGTLVWWRLLPANLHHALRLAHTDLAKLLTQTCPLSPQEGSLRRYRSAAHTQGHYVVASSLTRGIDCVGRVSGAPSTAQKDAS